MAPLLALAATVTYAIILFVAAQHVERRLPASRKLVDNAFVYSLGLTVFATSWSYYGSVGFVTSQGLLVLALYIGPTLNLLFGRAIWRRLIRLKDLHHVTSVADLLAARYGMSRLTSGIVTAILVLAMAPYVAVQLEAVSDSFALMASMTGGGRSGASISRMLIDVVVIVALIAFTVAFGMRRLDPTERHPGMLATLALQSVVKLAGLLAAWIFVLTRVFTQPSQFLRLLAERSAQVPYFHRASGAEVLTWLVHTLLSFVAFSLLPRQFHVGVVENSNEDHVRTAMWLVPLYLLLMTLFIAPIALAGLEFAPPGLAPDYYVLGLPLAQGQVWLSLLIFLGGFSAAFSMVMVEAVTMATMICNHLVLPLGGLTRHLSFVRHHLLFCRWGMATVFILLGYGFTRLASRALSLANMGLLSFAAVLQFMPALIGGLFWRRGNRVGAVLGVVSGFAVWLFTLIMPILGEGGWVNPSLLEHGVAGITALRPTALFGLEGLPTLTHGVLWSMAVNIPLYVLGSLCFAPAREDEEIAEGFVGIRRAVQALTPSAPEELVVDTSEKRELFQRVLSEYHSSEQAAAIVAACLDELGLSGKERLGTAELLKVYAAVERALAGAIGIAPAHSAMKQRVPFSSDERRALAASFAETLAGLRVAPEDLLSRVDYYKEREELLTRQASEMRAAILQLDREVAERRKAEERWRQSQAQLQAMMDNSSTVIYAKDLEGRFLLLNRRFEELFHLPHEAFLGKSDEDLFSAAQAAAIRANDQRALEAGVPIEVEEVIPQEDGLHIYISNKFPLRGADGRPYAICGISTDITERKRIDEERTRLLAQAQEAVQARDEFMAIASHELKTPLTPFGLLLDMLKRLVQQGELATYPAERLAKSIEISSRSLKKLAVLVDTLLDVSRITSGRLVLTRRPMDLSATVAHVLERFGPEIAASNYAVTLQLAPEVRGEWDEVRVEQIVANLLSNAFKYGEGRPVEIVTEQGRAVARFIVRDHGIGMSAEQQARIFQPFERAVSYLSAGGFGLGLYIVGRLVEAHEGSVRVESRPGEGSTFTVELPLAKASSR